VLDVRSSIHQNVNTPPAYPSYVPPQPPQKKSALPWIIGGCGCLFLVGLVGLGILGFGFYAAQQAEGKGSNSVFVVPSDWKRYNSMSAQIPASMQEHLVPFTFSFPPQFQIVPSSGNFVKVEEGTAPGTEDNFTFENFGVGYFNIPGDGVDAVAMPMLIAQLGSQFAAGFPGYREVSQFEEEVSGYKGRAMIFESELKGTPRGDVKIFGKLVMVRKPGATKGVTIIMLATTEDPEIKTVHDVGMKGDLPGIIQSFQLN
jgi:hypothetical protein